MSGETERERRDLAEELIDCLNDAEIRSTYGAIADLLAIHPMSVGGYLGPKRPDASWVVNKKTGRPTGFPDEMVHPNLYKNRRIIGEADELRKTLEAFRRSRSKDRKGGRFDSVVASLLGSLAVGGIAWACLFVEGFDVLIVALIVVGVLVATFGLGRTVALLGGMFAFFRWLDRKDR